jgi:transposase
MCTMRDSLVRARVQLSNCLRGWLRTEGIRLRAGGVETLPRRLRDQVKELPSYVTRQLEILDELTAKIVEAEREQAKLAKQNECARRLMTTPGVGPNTALRFIALLDDIERFPSAHKVEAYLGLVPGEDSSSDRQRRTGITKAGSPAMRHTLVQAAWAARRCLRQGPMQAWACEVERRRGKRVAALALARKLAGILFALWRDGSTYDARRGAATAS